MPAGGGISPPLCHYTSELRWTRPTWSFAGKVANHGTSDIYTVYVSAACERWCVSTVRFLCAVPMLAVAGKAGVSVSGVRDLGWWGLQGCQHLRSIDFCIGVRGISKS